MSAARREELTAEGLVVDLRSAQGFPRVVVQLGIAAFWAWLGRGLWATHQSIAFGGDIPFWLEPAAARGWSRPALYTAMAIAAYGAIASVVQAIGWLVRHDRIVLGAPGWSVRHRFGGGRSDIPWSDTGAPEAREVTGALVAWLSDGTALPVTALGAPEDRAWLAREMAQRARGRSDGTPAPGQSRVLGTHRITREADGTLLVHQTLAGRFGCLAMLALLGIGLLFLGLPSFDLAALVGGVALLATVWFLARAARHRIDLRARPGQLTLTGRDVLEKGTLAVVTTGTSTCQVQLVRPGARRDDDDSAEVVLLNFSGAGAAVQAQQIANWLATASGFPLAGPRSGD